MKTIKLLIIAVVAVAAVTGISQLLKNGNSNDDSGNGTTGVSRFKDLAQTIDKLEKSVWEKDLYVKVYSQIVARIESNRTNNNIVESEAKTLSNSVELAYIDILLKGIEAEISSCNRETMKQLKQELEEFWNMGTHQSAPNFEQTVQNMRDYEKTQKFINEVSALRYKKVDSTTKFISGAKATYYHNQAETLKENSFVTGCQRILNSLDNTDKDLCEAHLKFLEEKTELFLKSDFSALNSKSAVNVKFKSIETEFSDFQDRKQYEFYPYKSKQKTDSTLAKLESKKEELKKQFNNLNK
ncbi:MAG: hypothetical protein LBH60_02525 [Prevotellaceae bacterium]|jgi:hypothetical protein|nr:hypothetical protein [Prevotellaceae bacterium]